MFVRNRSRDTIRKALKVDYMLLVLVAGAISAFAAKTEERLPWGRRPSSSDRVTIAGAFGFGFGFIYLMIGHGTNDANLGQAGATMMALGFIVGLASIVMYARYEMPYEPTVAAVRQNEDRGPRTYAPNSWEEDAHCELIPIARG